MPDTFRGGISTETTMPLTWTAVTGAAKYRLEYRTGWFSPWITDDETITTASHTVDGLDCKTEYQFRVSAYGDGTAYPAGMEPPV